MKFYKGRITSSLVIYSNGYNKEYSGHETIIAVTNNGDGTMFYEDNGFLNTYSLSRNDFETDYEIDLNSKQNQKNEMFSLRDLLGQDVSTINFK